MAQIIDERRQLIITLGEHEAPAQMQWAVMRFLKNEDGSDAMEPQPKTVDATPDDVRAVFDNAAIGLNAHAAEQAARIEAMTKELADLRAAGIKDKTEADAKAFAAEAALERALGAVVAAASALAPFLPTT